MVNQFGLTDNGSETLTVARAEKQQIGEHPDRSWQKVGV